VVGARHHAELVRDGLVEKDPVQQLGAVLQVEEVVVPALEEDPESYYTIGGYYRNRLERERGNWKLVRVNLNVTWRLGHPEIMDAARAGAISASSPGE
jgi:hypothetical protein